MNTTTSSSRLIALHSVIKVCSISSIRIHSYSSINMINSRIVFILFTLCKLTFKKISSVTTIHVTMMFDR